MTSESFQNWTSNQRKLISWLALPSDARSPHTQGELAKQLGVTDRTISNWKNVPGLKEAAAELAKEQVTGELPDVYGALLKKAKAGSFFHIRLCLEIAGHYVERKVMSGDEENPIRHEHEHRVDYSHLSDEELRVHIATLRKLSGTTEGAFPSRN